MTEHKVGTQEEWQTARNELLAEEKELTRRSDELARKRRELPWVPVEKDYRFETEAGTKSLEELFDGRSQLLIYYFMFGPSYETACPVCSSMADTMNGILPHLNAARRDDASRLALAARDAPGLQAADGLEHSLGLIGRQRLQLRSRCLVYPRAGARAVGPCAGRLAGPA
jgi:predicted dithiol-disulfide oxidoreductase (DUF899 family)